MTCICTRNFEKDLNICKVTTIRTYIFQKITPIILSEPIFLFYLHQVLYSHHYKSKLCKVTFIQTYILQTITAYFLLEPIYFFYLHHVLYSHLFFKMRFEDLHGDFYSNLYFSKDNITLFIRTYILFKNTPCFVFEPIFFKNLQKVFY